MRWKHVCTLLLGGLALLSRPVGTAVAFEEDEPVLKVSDCSFQANPPEVLERESRIRRDVFQRAAKFRRQAASSQSKPVPAASIPRLNWVDDAIFAKLEQAGVPSARVTSDEELVRRVYLDFTGRTPTPAQVRQFVADPNPTKRNELIERLIWSQDFTDRWTLWMGDWLQNTPFPSSNIQPQLSGRNAFHAWIAKSIQEEKSIKDIAYQVVTANVGGARPANGLALDKLEAYLAQERPPSTYDAQHGASNFVLMSSAPMGPGTGQDNFDLMLYRTASAFLGMSHYDCLLCHDGRGHLDQISLWGTRTTRLEAERMAAFFARLRFSRLAVPNNPVPAAADYPLGAYYSNSYKVEDAPTGNYDLNTTSGNRPPRRPIGRVTSVVPEYHFSGATPSSMHWRTAFAENMVQDRMFARNVVNRIWKQLYGMGLAEPMDSLDPDRLDPKNPPPAPWSLQATHPELLEQLADAFVSSNYSLREMVKLMTQTSAYQLSSRYDGEWKLDYVNLFARHYPRRLEAEEVHDAVTNGSGNRPAYTITGWPEPVRLAILLPDTQEPRSNGTMSTWLNAFLRGNRDSVPRSQAGSMLQQLNLMNSTFVLDRIRVATANPNLMEAARLTASEEAVQQVFLLFLSRLPTAQERTAALESLAQAKTAPERNARLEDLAWVCINKAEFLFSY